MSTGAAPGFAEPGVEALRPSADWVAEARAEPDLDTAKVFALYAGTNAHAEGVAAEANPFIACSSAAEAALFGQWLFGWRTAESAAKDRANRQAEAEDAQAPDKTGQWWLAMGEKDDG